MSIPFISLLFQGIPEVTSLVILSCVIARIPFKFRKALLLGTVFSLCMYLVRLLPIPFGIHSVLLLFLLFIGLTRLSKGDVSLSFTASVLSFLALTVYEFGCMSLFMYIFRFTPETLFKDVFIRIIVGEPQVILLLTSAFLINKFYERKGYVNRGHQRYLLTNNQHF